MKYKKYKGQSLEVQCTSHGTFTSDSFTNTTKKYIVYFALDRSIGSHRNKKYRQTERERESSTNCCHVQCLKINFVYTHWKYGCCSPVLEVRVCRCSESFPLSRVQQQYIWCTAKAANSTNNADVREIFKSIAFVTTFSAPTSTN